MESGHRAKDETGNVYGIWFVTGIITPREQSNGCLKYKLVCRSCGAVKFVNGNNLRFGRYAKRCKRCGAKYETK